MSEYCVIGRRGFLGSALERRLGAVTSMPTEQTKVIFHCGGSCHMDFEQSPEYDIKRTIDSFTGLLPYCWEHGIRFVYASSALVYEKDTPFARFKKTLEQLASCYRTRTLGLRLFPLYGPGENRTVIAQWCRQMKRGERPKVYGDGGQARDFTYIDDAVGQIVRALDGFHFTREARVVDIGTGHPTRLIDIVGAINRELGTEIEPQFVPAPAGYSMGIACANPGPSRFTIEAGIREVLKAC